jgi:hypothetical protein
MIYTTAYWWQQKSSCTVSVMNVWPLDNWGAIPASVDLSEFDAVVVFPRLGYDPVALQFLDRRLATPFREYRGAKVLMRQDENLMTSFIEQFLIDNEFDALLSCVPPDQVPLAYPRLAEYGVEVHSMLTGYVSPDMRSFARSPYADRVFDVSYRAYRGGLQNGRLVFEKYQIGVDALTHFAGSGLTLDISMDPADRLTGAAWRERLDRSRSVLGTESGSNLFDHDGAVYRWAEEFHYEHRDASLSEAELYEIVRRRLSGVDGNVRYAQVSPRHFEAAAFGAMQIMYPGEYSGIFRAGRHYLELQRDFSNVDEIVAAIRDTDTFRRITDCAFEEIVMDPAYSIESAVSRLEQIVLAVSEAKSSRARVGADDSTSRRAGYDVVRGRIVQLVAAARTVRPLPYYFDESLAAAGGAAIRVALTTDEVPTPRRGGQYPWVELSLHDWVPNSSTLDAPGGVIADCVGRLTTAIGSSRDGIERELGGYDDPHGSIGEFRADCELALNAVWATGTWIADGFPAAAVMASDPMSLLASARLALELGVDLYIDFEGFVRVLDSKHGWQARFWQELTDELTTGCARCIVICTPDRSTDAVNRLGIEPRIVTAGADECSDVWTFVSRGPESCDSPGSSDTAVAARAQFVEMLHPKLRHPGPSLDDVVQEVLPFSERWFGVASTRYRSAVVNAANGFGARGDHDCAYDVLFYALDRWASIGAEQPGSSTLAAMLHDRRAAVPGLLLAVQPDMPLARARSTVDRFDADIPLTAANRAAAWRLLHRLLVLGDRSRCQSLFAVLTASSPARSTVELAADVTGLKRVLGHHWALGDYDAALPAAQALADMDALGANDGAELDDNTMARVRVVLESVGSDLVAEHPPRPQPWRRRRRRLAVTVRRVADRFDRVRR